MPATAVIPVAGRATRLRPLSAAVPKALLPLPGADGRLRPVIHRILAGAASAGIDRAVLVTSPGQPEALRAYLSAAREAGDDDLPEHIECVEQPSPAGLGDAVLCAADEADEPVVVLLGDHVPVPEPGRAGPVAQVLAAVGETGGEMVVGVREIGPEELPLCGVATGTPLGSEAGDGLYRCTEIVEKPDPATARERLVAPGLPAGRYLAHAGVYAFSRGVFDCLRERQAEVRPGAELQLTDAERLLLARSPDACFLRRVRGEVLDTGTPAFYTAAFARLAGFGPRPYDGPNPGGK